MAPALLDDKGFDAFVSEHEIAVVGFAGDDATVATISQLAAGIRPRADAAFGCVQADSRNLFDAFGLSGTALAIFRQRIVFYLEPGLVGGSRLDELLDRIGALDLAKVKSEIERERQESAPLAVHRVCPAARRGRPGGGQPPAEG
jgi:hypothetical protein